MSQIPIFTFEVPRKRRLMVSHQQFDIFDKIRIINFEVRSKDLTAISGSNCGHKISIVTFEAPCYHYI